MLLTFFFSFTRLVTEIFVVFTPEAEYSSFEAPGDKFKGFSNKNFCPNYNQFASNLALR